MNDRVRGGAMVAAMVTAVTAVTAVTVLGCTGKRDAPRPVPAPATAPAPAVDAPAGPAAAPADADSPTVADVELPAPEAVPAREAGLFLRGAGVEPKQRLVLSPTTGQARSAPVRMTMQLSVGLGGKVVPPTDIPAIALEVATKITEVTDAVATVEVSTAHAKADGDVQSDRVRKALEEAVQHLSAARATVTVDRAGGPSSMTMEHAGEATELQPSLDGLFDSLLPMFVSVPNEAVGVGARWEVVSHREDGGARLQQVVHYELTAVDDGVATVSWNTERGAVSVAATEGAHVSAHTAEGKGIVAYDLTTLAPRTSTADIRTRTHARVKFGDTASDVVVQQSTHVQLGASP
ncbi:MAG: hypothetical protein AAF721_24335 [Myxococcota bacterium]